MKINPHNEVALFKAMSIILKNQIMQYLLTDEAVSLSVKLTFEDLKRLTGKERFRGVYLESLNEYLSQFDFELGKIIVDGKNKYVLTSKSLLDTYDGATLGRLEAINKVFRCKSEYLNGNILDINDVMNVLINALLPVEKAVNPNAIKEFRDKELIDTISMMMKVPDE